MPFIGFRANAEKHSRLLAHLEPLFKKKLASEEARRLMELGLDVIEGKYGTVTNRRVKAEPVRSQLPWLNSHIRKE